MGRICWKIAAVLTLVHGLGCQVTTEDFDFDGDGFEDADDCNPSDDSIYPDAPDTFGDGVDQDCDGMDGIDSDGDGYPVNDDVGPELYDCDDADPLINPGADEVVNDGVDNDCDGQALEDQDLDDHYVGIDDCDDTDPEVYDGAEELTDCKDNDCDTLIDEGLDTADGDSDGYCVGVDMGSGAPECCEGAAPGDCDDSDALVNPGPAEMMDCKDNNCAAVIAEEFATADDDGDGYCEGEDLGGGGPECCDGSTPGDCDDEDVTTYPEAPDTCGDCLDNDCSGDLELDCDDDGDGFAECDGDCDDAVAYTYPAAVELCDGADNDCDGDVPAEEVDADGDGDPSCSDCDDGDAALDSLDLDGDGYSTCDGDCDDTQQQVYPGNIDIYGDAYDANCDGVDGEDDDGDGYVGNAPQGDPLLDCDDANAAINPDADDICDGLDNDCDGIVDPGVADNDGDGYSTCDGDCDDTDADTYPGATEICDGDDNDGDATLPAGEEDDDGDGWAVCEGDCDDTDATLNPGDVDGDGLTSCDGDCDDLDAAINPYDVDNDGYDTCGIGDNEPDCDDSDPLSHPTATETCDGQDTDCDGVVDDDCVSCDVMFNGLGADLVSLLNTSPAGTAICVEPGHYNGNFTFGSVDLHLAGLGGPHQTSLDAQGSGSVITISNGQTSATVVEGFRVIGGDDIDGPGIDVAQASPVLRNLEVSWNVSSDKGAITIEGPASPVLDTIRIEQNTSVMGAGLWIENATVSLSTIEVRANVASTYAGGMMVTGSILTMDNVSFSENQAGDSAGGLMIYDSTVTANNLFASDNISAGDGGGILLSEASLTVSNMVVMLNEAAVYGGGISLYDSDLIVQNAALLANEADTAGAMLAVVGGTMELSNMFIAMNTAATDIGGLLLYGSSPTITNVDIIGNAAGGEGGGIYVENSAAPNPVLTAAPVLNNVVVVQNSGATGGGIRLTSGTVTTTYCDVWDNTPDDYSGLADATGIDGNVSVEPLFLNPNPADLIDWNVHLQLGSSLIDMGDPALFDPDGSTSDIGAYGGSGAEQYDLDGDGFYEWWQPGGYDYVAYPALSWDCNDREDDIYPGTGC